MKEVSLIHDTTPPLSCPHIKDRHVPVFISGWEGGGETPDGQAYPARLGV